MTNSKQTTEVKTLTQALHRDVDACDVELAAALNDGWAIAHVGLDCGVYDGFTYQVRVVTLVRQKAVATDNNVPVRDLTALSDKELYTLQNEIEDRMLESDEVTQFGLTEQHNAILVELDRRDALEVERLRDMPKQHWDNGGTQPPPWSIKDIPF